MQNDYEMALDYLRQIRQIFTEMRTSREQAEELWSQGQTAWLIVLSFGIIRWWQNGGRNMPNWAVVTQRTPKAHDG